MPLNKYAHLNLHLHSLHFYCSSAYRPHITAHMHTKSINCNLYLPYYCKICASLQYAPQMPQTLHMHKIFDMNVCGKLPIYKPHMNVLPLINDVASMAVHRQWQWCRMMTTRQPDYKYGACHLAKSVKTHSPIKWTNITCTPKIKCPQKPDLWQRGHSFLDVCMHKYLAKKGKYLARLLWVTIDWWGGVHLLKPIFGRAFHIVKSFGSIYRFWNLCFGGVSWNWPPWRQFGRLFQIFVYRCIGQWGGGSSEKLPPKNRSTYLYGVMWNIPR